MRFRLLLTATAVLMGGWSLACPVLGAEPAAGSVARSSPADGGCLGTAEVSGPGKLIERIEASPALKAYLDSPLYQDALKSDPCLKERWRQGDLRSSIGNGSVVGGEDLPRRSYGARRLLQVRRQTYAPSPEGVLVVRMKDPADLTRLIEKLTPLLPLVDSNLRRRLRRGRQVVEVSRTVMSPS